jgi:hypothetical protein
MGREDEVRAAFATQALWCDRLGSPFTAGLCTLIGERLDGRSRIGARVLGWEGDPTGAADALALRLCGGLHALTRSGDAPALAALYPPVPAPDADALWAAIVPWLDDPKLARWLESPPQTNEVGRAAALMAGLLVVARRFGLPFSLYELGTSAGLNLQLDRYAYDLGGLRTGDPDSALQLAPDWTGPPPPAGNVRIVARAGVDLNPPDPAILPAYVWADQFERVARIETALSIAAADPPPVEQDGAADWLETRLSIAPEAGVTRVVMHSVAFQYFDGETQARVAAHIERTGAAAREQAPLAWLSFENEPGTEGFALRLSLWPGERNVLLARAHPHGQSVRWLRSLATLIVEAA